MAGRFNLKPSTATHRRQVSAPSVGSVEHQASVVNGTHAFLKETQIAEYDNDSSGDEHVNLIDLQPKEPVHLAVQNSTTATLESQVQNDLPPPPTHGPPQAQPPRKVPRSTDESIQFRPRREKDLEETILKLQSERDQSEQAAKFHSAEHQTMIAKYQELSKLAMGQQEEIKQSRKECERTAAGKKQWKERCALLEKDNDLLRGQITNMSSAQEPIHEEEWFILQFSQIGMDIESWAAKETRVKPSEPLSAAHQQFLLDSLNSWGGSGEKDC